MQWIRWDSIEILQSFVCVRAIIRFNGLTCKKRRKNLLMNLNGKIDSKKKDEIIKIKYTQFQFQFQFDVSIRFSEIFPLRSTSFSDHFVIHIFLAWMVRQKISYIQIQIRIRICILLSDYAHSRHSTITKAKFWSGQFTKKAS